MRYAYHDAAFPSHYDSTIFNFQSELYQELIGMILEK